MTVTMMMAKIYDDILYDGHDGDDDDEEKEEMNDQADDKNTPCAPHRHDSTWHLRPRIGRLNAQLSTATWLWVTRDSSPCQNLAEAAMAGAITTIYAQWLIINYKRSGDNSYDNLWWRIGDQISRNHRVIVLHCDVGGPR